MGIYSGELVYRRLFTMKTSTFLSFCILLMCSVVVVSCDIQDVQHSDLVGVFSADYKSGREHLILNSDGKFEQTVTVKSSGKVIKAIGSWKFHPSDRDIVFDDNFLVIEDGFEEFDPDFERPKIKGIVVIPVLRKNGYPQLGGHPGIIYFWKAPGDRNPGKTDPRTE